MISYYRARMRIQRYSDVVEAISERAIYFFLGGIGCGIVAGLLFRYKGDGMFLGLAWVAVLAAVGLIGYGVYILTGTRKLESFSIQCPICYESNELTTKPENDDVTCVACNHRIPILNGVVLPVQQVRCGFCSHLNYYSEKTELLICENCNREIPIFQEEGKPQKHLPKGFVVIDDNTVYELVLTGGSKQNEELVKTLQSMLALNRNQVRDILEDLPQVLLQGINRTKGDMLSAQIKLSNGEVELRPMQNP